MNLLHLNLHGLIRTHDLELGRDADTGGQTLYVLELVKGLALRPEVNHVELVTRLIQDRRVSVDYSKIQEDIAPGASITRIPFGPKRYLKKEMLWPFLDDLADHLVSELQSRNSLPDWIHAHYADAGYVGALISRRLGIPMVFTAHSLGREKQRRLLAAGIDREHIEQTYCISRRIDAEEFALAHSNLIITSTKQEAEKQYSRYGNYKNHLAKVVPPGVDSKRFNSIQSIHHDQEVDKLFAPFLKDVSLPPLLAISRAVRRKNIPALVEAYGRSHVLRQRHNLILVLGCREDPRQMEKTQREVFQQIFDLVDKYNLYGKVAYPKYHRRDQIPSIYRWAAKRKGLFVNPALTEPFGLTLLEAAACGLPMVTTDDGGPRDILSRCSNGLLVDVTDLELLQDSLEQAGSNITQWQRWSDNGIEAVCRHFSWDAHVCNYLALMQKRLKKTSANSKIVTCSQENKTLARRLLLLDLDSSFEYSDPHTFNTLRKDLEQSCKDKTIGLGILTGRSLKAARYKFQELSLPQPCVWISRAGTEISYGLDNRLDKVWKDIISKDWNRKNVERSLFDLKEHLELQDIEQQSDYKLSYLLKEQDKGILQLVRKKLRQRGQLASIQMRCHWYLDVIPFRASRAEAIRHISIRWNLPLEHIFVLAGQQGDAELLLGLNLAVVPYEHDSSLEKLRSHQRIFFATKEKASGLIEGLNHYKFLINR